MTPMKSRETVLALARTQGAQWMILEVLLDLRDALALAPPHTPPPTAPTPSRASSRRAP